MSGPPAAVVLKSSIATSDASGGFLSRVKKHSNLGGVGPVCAQGADIGGLRKRTLREVRGRRAFAGARLIAELGSDS